MYKEQIRWAYTLQGGNLSKNEQDTVLKFVLLFNVFEARLFNPGQVNPRLTEMCEDLNNEKWFCVKEYDRYGRFFVDRYIINAEGNNRLRHLKRGMNQENTERLKNALTLLRHGQHDTDLFYSYLQIAYGFRNNLFHGSKEVLCLNLYYSCFRQINWLIHKLLSDMVDQNFKGLENKYPRR